MGRYRRYLFTGEKIPRSTLYSRRRAKQFCVQTTTNQAATDTALQSVCPEMSVPTNQEESGNADKSVHSLSLADDEVMDNTSGTELLFASDISHAEDSSGESGSLQDSEDSSIACGSLQDSTSSNEDRPTTVRSGLDQEKEDCSVPCDEKEDTVREEFKKLTSKLCQCGDTTVGDVVFMCLVLGLRHNLTWDAQVDILKMISSIHNTNEIPTNKRAYFSGIENVNHVITYHIFCPNCELYLGKKDDAEELKVCTQCNCDVNVSHPSNFFLSLSLEAQLKMLIGDANVANMLLTHRFSRKKESEGAIEDIYDGAEYKKHCSEGGILSSPLNFSWSFNTDGVPTGKATGKTMWPIYLTLNELPYKERSKYMLLGGLYIGSKDPNPLVFLQPFVEEANKLSSDGFSWVHNGKSVISKVIPLCAVTDSVARWQVLNFQSFHAYFGCTFCYQKQEPTMPKKRRFNILSEKAVERTAESTCQDALKAHELRSASTQVDHYRGVKGPSVLFGLLYFNLIWGFTIDYMHAILTGITKTHIKCLFDSSRKKFWVGVNDRVGIDDIMKSIDERLLLICPPTSITRVPRSITMYKIWKCSEWRSWLLFYCVPCLEGLLKEKHVTHLAMLSKATCMLLQKSITVAEVKEAHSLLINYCHLFQKYFDIQDTIYNVHLLTHISKCVLNWGPLWAHNAFCFESQNRHLLQLYKSPSNVVLQIARKFLVFASIPSLCSKLVSSDGAIEFTENILDRKLTRFVRCGQCIVSGKIYDVKLTLHEEVCLADYNIGNFRKR